MRICRLCHKYCTAGVHFIFKDTGTDKAVEYDICRPCAMLRKPLVIPGEIRNVKAKEQTFNITYESFEEKSAQASVTAASSQA